MWEVVFANIPVECGIVHRQTRRSSHVWLQKLVSLEQNFSSVSKRTFQIDSITE